MFNDTATPATLLATRRSGKPRDMVAPGPNAAQLRHILSAAIRVPDHGKLAPWRFLVVGEAARDDFAALLHEAYCAAKPGPGRVEVQAVEDFARHAPALVVAISSPVTTSHIPLWEQELSCGAACMNLLTAAHAQGFVGGWLTGWATYSEPVATGLGLTSHEKIAGFIFLGTPSRDLEERPRPDYERVVSEWSRS